jgi:hypothetical protein
MDILQGSDATFWVWMGILLTVALTLATWFFTIVGADRKKTTQKRGESTIEHYGDIQEDRAPVPKFLVWTYVGVAIWAVGYAITTGIYGSGL